MGGFGRIKRSSKVSTVNYCYHGYDLVTKLTKSRSKGGRDTEKDVKRNAGYCWILLRNMSSYSPNYDGYFVT